MVVYYLLLLITALRVVCTLWHPSSILTVLIPLCCLLRQQVMRSQMFPAPACYFRVVTLMLSLLAKSTTTSHCSYTAICVHAYALMHDCCHKGTFVYVADIWHLCPTLEFWLYVCHKHRVLLGCFAAVGMSRLVWTIVSAAAACQQLKPILLMQHDAA